jgi:hypothetical protein
LLSFELKSSPLRPQTRTNGFYCGEGYGDANREKAKMKPPRALIPFGVFFYVHWKKKGGEMK